MGKRRRRQDPVLPEAHEGSSRLTSTSSAEGPAYLEGQQGLALEEAAADLPLDLLQVELLRGLPALLHLVLAVGEDQWDQVTLHFVTDNMQVSDLRGIHGVAEGQEIQSWCPGQVWASGFGACAPASASWCEQAALHLRSALQFRYSNLLALILTFVQWYMLIPEGKELLITVYKNVHF